jgi:hypothetical protein
MQYNSGFLNWVLKKETQESMSTVLNFYKCLTRILILINILLILQIYFKILKLLLNSIDYMHDFKTLEASNSKLSGLNYNQGRILS